MRSAAARTPWDVVAFVVMVTAFIWLVIPTGLPEGVLKVIAGSLLAIPILSLRLYGYTPEQVGLRFGNFARSLPVYLAAALLFAGVTLLWNHDRLTVRGFHGPLLPGLIRTLGWTFLQEFLLLGFLLTRLRDSLRNDVWAVATAAVLFSFFHLPNPFLTLYTLGGGVVLGAVYCRWPNLWAATVAHFGASGLASRLLDRAVTGGMKVGPRYWEEQDRLAHLWHWLT